MIDGIPYASLTQVIEQFGGYVDIAAGRAQVNLERQGAIITFDAVRVEASRRNFALRHPLRRDGDEAFMAINDFETFFRHVFDIRLWVDQVSADTSSSESTDLDEMLAPLDLRPREPQPARLRRIVVDAGHGGTDTGAAGPAGLEEKEVTLAVARLLQQDLAELTGAEIALTREEDAEMPDRARSNFAGRSEADLIISLHTGASYAAHARGFEIFYAEPADVSEEDDSSNPRRVNYAARSRLLASAVARGLTEAGISPNRGVRPTPSRVLRAAPMPGIVVELGCITDEADEALLATDSHQAALAQGIAQGVRAYADGLSQVRRDQP